MIGGLDCTANHEMGTYMGASGRYDGLLGWLVVIAERLVVSGTSALRKKYLFSTTRIYSELFTTTFHCDSMENSFERQTERDTLVSEANALAKDLTAYTELCLRVLPNNTQWKSGLKDKLSAVEKIAMPVVTALQQCINDDMSQTSVRDRYFGIRIVSQHCYSKPRFVSVVMIF